jgi:hypothetical protein
MRREAGNSSVWIVIRQLSRARGAAQFVEMAREAVHRCRAGVTIDPMNFALTCDPIRVPSQGQLNS